MKRMELFARFTCQRCDHAREYPSHLDWSGQGWGEVDIHGEGERDVTAALVCPECLKALLDLYHGAEETL